VDVRDGDGRPVAALLAQPRRLALLAMLAIESMDGACMRERLMAAFWPDHPPAQAAANLRQALAFLRRLLGDEVIVAHGRQALAIDAGRLACDAVDALRTGLPSRTGGAELLAGLHLDDVGEAWEAWLGLQRRRLSELAPGATPPAPTALPADAEARAAYLHGRFHWTRRPRESAKALKHLERAVALAPDFALGHAALADVYNTLGSWESGALAPVDAFPRARSLAQRALAIDPCCAPAHTSLAYTLAHYDWDWARAGQQFERAVALDPGYAHAHHWRAHLWVAQGRFDEALAAGQRALELQPLDIIINGHMAWHHWFAREPDAAIEQADRTADLDETDHWAPFFRGMACAHCGRGTDAVDALRLACALSRGNAVMRAGLGFAYAAAGDRRPARAVLREFDAAATDQHRYAYEAAVIHVALGDADAAFARLQDALGARSAWMLYLAVDPRLDPLRSDPRYAALAAALVPRADAMPLP
jgi:tetratricopeptide (TPR) repeat protein